MLYFRMVNGRNPISMIPSAEAEHSQLPQDESYSLLTPQPAAEPDEEEMALLMLHMDQHTLLPHQPL